MEVFYYGNTKIRQSTIDRLNGEFERLVPNSGKADTKAGEIVRALNRIGYRYLNDGDKVGQDYGNETCNPAARFLGEKLPETLSDQAYGLFDYEPHDNAYEEKLDRLIDETLTWLYTKDLDREPNAEDMHDWERLEDREYLNDYEEWPYSCDDEDDDFSDAVDAIPDNAMEDSL